MEGCEEWQLCCIRSSNDCAPIPGQRDALCPSPQVFSRRSCQCPLPRTPHLLRLTLQKEVPVLCEGARVAPYLARSLHVMLPGTITGPAPYYQKTQDIRREMDTSSSNHRARGHISVYSGALPCAPMTPIVHFSTSFLSLLIIAKSLLVVSD